MMKTKEEILKEVSVGGTLVGLFTTEKAMQAMELYASQFAGPEPIGDEEIEAIANQTYDDLLRIGVSKHEAESHKVSWSKGCKFMRDRIFSRKNDGE